MIPSVSDGSTTQAGVHDGREIDVVATKLGLGAELPLLDEVEAGMRRGTGGRSLVDRRDRVFVCILAYIAGRIVACTPSAMSRIVEDLTGAGPTTLLPTEEALHGNLILLLPQAPVIARARHLERAGVLRSRRPCTWEVDNRVRPLPFAANPSSLLPEDDQVLRFVYDDDRRTCG